MKDAYETTEFAFGVTAGIVQDTDPMFPGDWDNVGKIAYLTRSRNVLGTEAVSDDRMEEIAEGIRSGELIGLPVYAYVHGGATIRCGSRGGWPFTCPWDAGLSGFVYCTREKALAEFGKKLMTDAVRKRALKCLEAEVDTFDQYLTGDVYGYVVERDGEHLDSCFGYYGIEAAREAMRDAAAYCVEQIAHEQAHREAECQTM